MWKKINFFTSLGFWPKPKARSNNREMTVPHFNTYTCDSKLKEMPVY